jgi:hypothetical protein
MGAQGSSSGQFTGLEPRRRGVESRPLRQFDFRDHASYQQSFAFRYPAFSASASLANMTRFFSLMTAALRQFGL